MNEDVFPVVASLHPGEVCPQARNCFDWWKDSRAQKSKTRLTATWPFLSPGPLSSVTRPYQLRGTGNEIGLTLTFSDWFSRLVHALHVLCFGFFVFVLLSFTFLFPFFFCRQSKQVQETVGRRRNGEPKYKKIARLLVRMLGNLWLKYFLMGNVGPEGPEVNASCHDGIDLDFRSVGEHTFRGIAIFKLNISCKAQLLWKNRRTNLVLFLAVYLLYRLE